MIIRITRALLVIQLIIAIGVAVLLVRIFHFGTVSALLAGIAAVLLARMQIIANNFFVSSLYRSPISEAHRLNFWQWARLFLQEYGASMWSSSFTMPFRPFSERVFRSPALPVVLIHGYGCNSGYWHAMSKALAEARISHYAVSMEPLMCAIDDYVESVRQAVDAICRASGKEKVVLVGHSMGGLVARAYLRDHGTARIAKVITLGTPHHGTALARFGVGENCRQMQWISAQGRGTANEWLRALAAGEEAGIARLLVSIYSLHDNIVSPQHSSRVPGAINIEMHGIGHVALAFHPAVQAQVVAEIEKASRGAPVTVSGGAGTA